MCSRLWAATLIRGRPIAPPRALPDESRVLTGPEPRPHRHVPFQGRPELREAILWDPDNWKGESEALQAFVALRARLGPHRSAQQQTHLSLRPGNGTRVPLPSQALGFRFHCPSCTTGCSLLPCGSCRGLGRVLRPGLGSQRVRAVASRCGDCRGAGAVPCPECGVRVVRDLRRPDPTGEEYWNRLDAIEAAREAVRTRNFRVPILTEADREDEEEPD